MLRCEKGKMISEVSTRSAREEEKCLKKLHSVGLLFIITTGTRELGD